jgi:hypothetical protein
VRPFCVTAMDTARIIPSNAEVDIKEPSWCAFVMETASPCLPEPDTTETLAQLIDTIPVGLRITGLKCIVFQDPPRDLHKRR